MKKIFFSICLTIMSALAFAQWTWQNPYPTGNHLQSVYFTDPNTGYAVGDSGTILITIDGGINWSGLQTETTDQLNSVFFSDVNTGYAVGGYVDYTNNGSNVGTILKTTDRGTTWNTISSDTLPYLHSVFFINVNTGYVGGYRLDGWGGQGWNGYGVILKTTDGGTIWTESSSTYECINSIDFTDTNTGYAVGFGLDGSGLKMEWVLFSKTIDGGLFWDSTFVSTKYTSHDRSLNSICFPDAKTGYASGPKSIFKTTDAGANWTQVLSLSSTDAELSSVYFYDASIGYAVGANGTILKTTNAGETWNAQASGTTNRLSSVFFTDANTGYVVGEHGTILKTTNGGGPLGIEETPDRESVLSAYPNPFCDNTTIEYTLAQNTSVTLAIFNHLGQSVTTLVNKPQPKGKQQIQWNTAGLQAGIYYCRLQAGNQTFSAKLIKIQ